MSGGESMLLSPSSSFYVPPKGGLLTAAARAVGAQLEGGALGGFTLADILAGAAHRDLLEGAHTGGARMIGAGVDRTLDAGVGFILVTHKIDPPLIAFGYRVSMGRRMGIMRSDT